MTVEWEQYAASFTARAAELGRDDQFVLRTLAYAKPLVAAGLPVIFDFAHLSALLGFEHHALGVALFDRSNLYRVSFVPKRAGGYRRIDAPVDSLKEAQQWILRQILDRVPPHRAAFAFFSGRSIRGNAMPHIGRPMVLSLDVKDFFPSITAPRIHAVFRGLGYAEEVAGALTALTTLNGGLPQGAPTSPALSNLVLRGFDRSLWIQLRSQKCRYSRYADDITISGVFRVAHTIALVRSNLHHVGLTLNEDKTRLMLRHQRQEVTGVVINTKLQAPRSMRRELRHQLHMVQRFGIPAEVGTDPIRVEKYLRRLRGTAEFILFLNPSDRDAVRAVNALGRIRY